MIPLPPSSPLFPYTTLFRSRKHPWEFPARDRLAANHSAIQGHDPSATVSPRPESQNDLLRADRKSTRLNSSHVEISYAVFCLKKKKERRITPPPCASPGVIH